MRVLIVIGAFLLYWPTITTNLFGDGLYGYEPPSPAPEWGVSAWLDGRFQPAADQWWRERFGLRFFFVKTNNQINYWLFDRVYEGAQSIATGKQDWLYEIATIESYCGLRGPIPSDRLRSFATRIRAFQDAMDARGVPFVLLITPSKPAVYPENLPNSDCGPQPRADSEYERGTAIFRETGVRYVDGFRLVDDAKALWPEVTLYTRAGAHWNNLGAYYAAAAMLDMAGALANRDLPPLALEDVVIDNKPTGLDQDLLHYANLFFEDTDFPTAHPKVSMPVPADGPLRGVFVGMSYLQEVLMIYADTDAFEQLDHYWYYHTSIRDALHGGSRPISRETVDWAGEILQADLLVLDVNMMTILNMAAVRFLDDGLAWLADNPI